MSGKQGRKPRARPAVGEDFLNDIAAIEITLESGKRVEFAMADQFPRISGPDEALEELKTLPERIAFFAAQRDRALHSLRKSEAQYDADLGVEYVLHHRNIDDNTSYVATRDLVKAHVDSSGPIRKKRVHLNSLRKQYDALRSLVQALEHRIYATRTIAQKAFKD